MKLASMGEREVIVSVPGAGSRAHRSQQTEASAQHLLPKAKERTALEPRGWGTPG